MISAHALARRKSLLWLAAGAGIVWLLLGLSSLSAGSSSRSHAQLGAPILDQFSETRAEAQRIRFTLSDERYTLARTAAGWVLEETGGYPIQSDLRAELLLGLEDLRFGEKRTNDATKHELIGLGDPANGGNGARVEIFGPGADLMHSFIIGRKNEALYVRAPDDTQTYRAEGILPAFYNRRAWLDLDIVNIDPSAIRSIRILDSNSQSVYLRRREGEDTRSFRPAPPNQDDRLISRFAASSTALAVTRLAPADIKPASDLTTQPIAQHISETFDGLELDVKAYREPYGLWLTIRAIEAGEGARRAQVINARAEGWAFRVSDYDFQDFTPLVSSLVERAD
jgi:Domain of unknown function (DUF4340)